MRYYIPGRVNGETFYAVLDGPDIDFVHESEVEVDSFSAVANPGLRPGWDEGTRLSEDERRSFEQAPRAYTRAWMRHGSEMIQEGST